MNCTNGTCKWQETSGGWNISKLKLKRNIISEVAPLSLLGWRSSGSYSIVMLSTPHTSVVGFCMSFFDYKLKITALAILPYLNFYFVSYSMEMQACRRLRMLGVGFMDPIVINETIVRDHPPDALENLYFFLNRQHDKGCILLPYNYQ